MQKQYETIQSLGAELVAISPQEPEQVEELRRKYRLTYPVLSDRGNAYAKQLSLAFTAPENLRAVYRQFEIVLPDFNGDDSWQLPIPARVIVDRQGAIVSIDADPDYTRRPEPEATVEALRRLGGP